MGAIDSLREFERRVKAMGNNELPLQDRAILELANEIRELRNEIEQLKKH